jgi:hypothetical protein
MTSLVTYTVYVLGFYLLSLRLFSYQSQSHLTTDGQSASLSWYQVFIWDPRSIFLTLARKLSAYILSSLTWGALSDQRLICNLFVELVLLSASAVILWSTSCRTWGPTSLPHLTSSSRFVASYNSHSNGEGNLTSRHTGSASEPVRFWSYIF